MIKRKYEMNHLEMKTLPKAVNSIMHEFELFKVKEHSDYLFFNVKLVIWELLANIIEHAGEDKAQIEVEEDFTQIIVRIRSFSEGFGWEEYRNMDCPEVGNERGRGLYLIQQLCDFSYNETATVATAIFQVKEVGVSAAYPY